NTREPLLPLMALPLMAKRLAPGPEMVRPFLMSSSPLVSVMVWPFRLGSKLMVSPLCADAIAARSDPGPLSLVVVTVLGTQRCSNPSSMGRKRGRAAGLFLRDAGRGDRRKRLDSQRVNDMGRVSFSGWPAI